MAHNTSDSRLWYFYNETRSGGYLSHGWEWIVGKELWLWLPEVGYMNHDMEEKGIVGRECIPLEPCFPPPRQRSALITASWSRGGGPSAARLRRETTAVNNPFLLHVVLHAYFRESKPKFLSPNSFSTMAEITPTKSFVVEIPETRVRRVMRHHTNSRMVIQITRKCTTLALQSWSSISK